MDRKQRVIVLGATGSIGRTALEVARDFPDRFDVVGLSTHRNTDLLERQVREFAPRAVCVSDPARAREAATSLRPALGPAGDFTEGEAGLTALVERCDADLLVVATVGLAGLEPTLAGIARGMRIALANKEVLVAAGELVLARAREAGVAVVPLDSEHSAIMQCLAGCDRVQYCGGDNGSAQANCGRDNGFAPSNHGRDNRFAPYVRRLVLTASGGPFRGLTAEEMDGATPEQALRHPTWRMGRKITVDSATLMNKGLEVIEACHLFGVPPASVEVVVHPQSVVHSLVEFRDGTMLAQMGPTSMYLPILAGMAWPEQLANKLEPLDLTRLGRLDFAAPDTKTFPCLAYAYEAIVAGGLLPAAMSAANEVAVEAFLAGRIPFGAIARTVRHTMDRYAAAEPTAARPDRADEAVDPDIDKVRDNDLAHLNHVRDNDLAHLNHVRDNDLAQPNHVRDNDLAQPNLVRENHFAHLNHVRDNDLAHYLRAADRRARETATAYVAALA